VAALARSIRLYLVTNRHRTSGRPLLEVVTAALRGGVDAVQLREKDLNTRELLELARTLVAVCRRYRVPLLVNDRVDVALAAGADGVHLPAASFRCDEAKRLLGRGIVGVSAHSVREVEAAASAGADFVVLGPIFATPDKTEGAPLGPAVLAQASARVRIPVLAIGGVQRENVAEVRAGGAAGVAVIRAICEAESPEAAAASLRIDWAGDLQSGKEER
jgi:thiamine-phosphate pyrophosphorylase